MPLSMTYEKIKEFLDAVDKMVIQIGVRERIDLIHVLQSRNYWSAPELQSSVSAMLSTNSDQYRQIGVIFNKYILNHEPNKEFAKSHQNEEEEPVVQTNEKKSEQSSLYAIFGDFFKNNLRPSLIVSLTLIFFILYIWGSAIIVNIFSLSFDNQSINIEKQTPSIDNQSINIEKQTPSINNQPINSEKQTSPVKKIFQKLVETLSSPIDNQ